MHVFRIVVALSTVCPLIASVIAVTALSIFYNIENWKIDLHDTASYYIIV